MVLLDCRRVHSIDAVAKELLVGLRDVVAGYGASLVVADPPPSLANAFGTAAFDNVDLALEWCEDELLRAEGVEPLNDATLLLADQELLAGLTADSLAAVEKATDTAVLGAGDVVFDEGDPGDRLYFVSSGQVSIRVEVSGRVRRLATLGPGSAFGELAILDGEPRSTSVVADQPTTCFVLRVAALAAIEAVHPHDITRFHTNLAASLARRLRLANAEVRALEA